MKRIFKLIFLLIPMLTGAQTGDCWPIFRGGSALNGLTSAKLPQSLNILWTYNGNDVFKGSPVVCEGTIVVASMDGVLHALDTDGNKKWSFKSENSFEAPALIFKGNVYIGDLDGILHCLNLSDGEKVWEFKTDGQITGSPNSYTVGNTDVLLFGSYDYFFYALNASDGSLLWKYESDNFINGAPSCQNGNVVFGGCDGFLHVLDILSGEVKKKVEVATYVAGSPSLDGNLAFTGDYDGRFSAIDIENEKVAWQWDHETKNLPFIASPALSGDKVIAGSRDKFLYCFHKTKGELLWEHNTGSRIDASVVISGNNVVVVNMRGDVLVLNTENGSVVMAYELGAAISATPALIDGKLIIAAEDGVVYCLGE